MSCFCDSMVIKFGLSLRCVDISMVASAKGRMNWGPTIVGLTLPSESQSFRWNEKDLSHFGRIFKIPLTTGDGFRQECHTYSGSYPTEVENQMVTSTFAEVLRHKHSAPSACSVWRDAQQKQRTSKSEKVQTTVRAHFNSEPSLRYSYFFSWCLLPFWHLALNKKLQTPK